jgi:hypothetical protein
MDMNQLSAILCLPASGFPFGSEVVAIVRWFAEGCLEGGGSE